MFQCSNLHYQPWFLMNHLANGAGYADLEAASYSKPHYPLYDMLGVRWQKEYGHFTQLHFNHTSMQLMWGTFIRLFAKFKIA
jgi:hypothetical protein